MRRAVLVLVLCFAAPPVGARELWRGREAFFDAAGELRQIGVLTRGTSDDDFALAVLAFPALCAVDFANCPAFGSVGETRVANSTTRLRLRAEARANAHFSAVIAVDNELQLGTLDTFEAQLGDQLGGLTFVDAEGRIGDDRVAWVYRLYRGYLLFESKHFETSVGRQRIPWGVGRLWNPIDRFNAIRPLAIESDQSGGVDAIDARVPFGGFHQLEAVFAPGPSSDQHAYAGRLRGVLFDVDCSLMGGVWDGAPAFGFDLAGNLGKAAARTEVVYTHPTRSVWPFGQPLPRRLPDFWQLVAGIDYSFSLGNGLYALIEHLYNGNALGFGRGLAGVWLGLFERSPLPPFVRVATPERFGGSRVVTRSENLTGAQLGYDLTPALRADLLTIYDWQGQSATFFPSLRVQPFDWLELTLGVQLPLGRRLSEFGSNPITGFLLGDIFF